MMAGDAVLIGMSKEALPGARLDCVQRPFLFVL